MPLGLGPDPVGYESEPVVTLGFTVSSRGADHGRAIAARSEMLGESERIMEHVKIGFDLLFICAGSLFVCFGVIRRMKIRSRKADCTLAGANTLSA